MSELTKQSVPESIEDVDAIIAAVERTTKPYVVVLVTEDGIGFRDEEESACEVMSMILGRDCSRVMKREKFIDNLRIIRAEIESEEKECTDTSGNLALDC